MVLLRAFNPNASSLKTLDLLTHDEKACLTCVSDRSSKQLSTLGAADNLRHPCTNWVLLRNAPALELVATGGAYRVWHVAARAGGLVKEGPRAVCDNSNLLL